MKTAIILLGMLIVNSGDTLIVREFETPRTIPVRITGEKVCEEGMPFTIEHIEFKEYVKGVLPNEWHVDWHEESLKAGAVAIKSFAWSKVVVGAPIWDCTWSQVYDPSRRIDITDRAVEETWDYWLINEEGNPVRTFYNANEAGCKTQPPDCMSQFDSQRHAKFGSWGFDRILRHYYPDGLLVIDPKPEEPPRFPFVSQITEDAQYYDDCGSASIKMVAEYYGVAGSETVDEVHKDMMDGDYPANYLNVSEYIESKYGLETRVVTTYGAVKDMLEELEFDVSMIEVVDDVPIDKPVIWTYAVTPHWVVRFDGMNYDPYNGVFPFDETSELRNLYRPDLGLGIIVTSD